MLPKPSSCAGCPLYGDGQGFVEDERVEGAPVMILGQNPGVEEERAGHPFVGKTGTDMEDTYFPLAGLERGRVSIGNTIRCRWQHNGRRTDELPTGRTLVYAADHCGAAHLSIPAETRLIVAQGALAWKWTQGKLAERGDTWSISNWRGFLGPARLRGALVYAVLHLADLYRDRKMTGIARLDWKKIPAILDGTWPKPWPTVETDPSAIQWESGMAFDTEYVPDTNFLVRFSLYTPSGGSYVIEYRDWLRYIQSRNCAATSVQSKLSQAFEGHTVRQVQKTENTQRQDTRPLSNVLVDPTKMVGGGLSPTPEALQGDRTVPDVLPRKPSADGMEATLAPNRVGGFRFPTLAPSPKRPLLHLQESETVGSRPLPPHGESSGLTLLLLQSRDWVLAGQHPDIASGYCIPFEVIFQNALVDLPHLARLLPVGVVISVQDTMLGHSCLWSELPHDLGFMASMYSPFAKTKHLSQTDPITYAAGDAWDTYHIWEALAAGLSADSGALGDYRSQRLPLLPIIMEAHDHGLKVNQPRVAAALTEYQSRCDEATQLVAAWCGWPINVGSEQQLKAWLYEVDGFPAHTNRTAKSKVTVDDDAIAALRQRYSLPFDPDDEERHPPTVDDATARVLAGAHGLLESRAIYARTKQLVAHYLEPLAGRTRIYPRTAIHAQANGRWSTTEPPLAQLPETLRDIIQPDTGTAWIGWDWQAIEPRLLMGYARSQFLANVFEKGWDIHTIGLCDVMGWAYPADLCHPEHDTAWAEVHAWHGKDDKRRRLAKVIRYKKYYGGNDASEIPGIHLLGLPKARLKQAGDLILRSDPDLRVWMRQSSASIARNPIVRDFTGARRALLGSKGHAAAREALNYPMQRGVQSIANLTAIAIKAAVPDAIYAWSMHDSQQWQVPLERVNDVLAILTPLVEQPYVINGVTVALPAKFVVTR